MLRDLLQERADGIAARWFACGLEAYAPEAATLLGRQPDQFANPVGHALRAGTRTVLNALLDGEPDEAVRAALDGIVAVRAVQQLRPSCALAFVFGLKDAVRAELGEACADPGTARELSELDARVDAIALIAFDAYVACRERVAELRIRELKRNIPWVVTRASQVVVNGEPG